MPRWVATVAVLSAVASGGSSCTSPAAPAEPETCASGEGHWIEDDNDYWSKETHVTVRLCLSENGQVLDMEVE
jgi:hypothetical protein